MNAKAEARALDPTCDATRIDLLVAELADHGYAVAERLIAPELVDRLIGEAMAREHTGDMAHAAVGRDETRSLETRIRHVDSVWIDGQRDGEAAVLGLAEHIRRAINQQLFLGLFEFEAQFLTYPPGGFYKRHLDSLKGARNRVVSMVLYLNPGWQPEHGGELDIWMSEDEQGAPCATVEPRAGTLVLMLSEEIPHAVRAAHATRRVIAGWFRVNASTTGRVDPSR